MANGDASGEKVAKIRHAARRDAISTELQNYTGDAAGRNDKILQMQDAAAAYARIACST
jgi:hypothetical protein